MGLFSRKNSDDSRNITLGEYDKISTRFCFLDESGTLAVNDSQNPYFTIGLIKCTQPYYLNSKIQYERQKRNFHDEMKFNKISKNNFDFAKFMIDVLFSTQYLFSYTYTLNKNGQYFNKKYGGDTWQAYEDIAITLIEAALHPKEIVIVIADYITTPKEIRFEVNVKRKINEKNKTLTVAGVARFDSRSNDILQLVDLLIGIITYDLKLATGVILKGDKHKRRLVEYFKNKLKISNLISGFRNHNFNIFVDKDLKKLDKTPM